MLIWQAKPQTFMIYVDSNIFRSIENLQSNQLQSSSDFTSDSTVETFNLFTSVNLFQCTKNHETLHEIKVYKYLVFIKSFSNALWTHFLILN